MCVASSCLQVYDSRRAIALHRVELQVPLEVLGIQTGDGQTISKTSLKVGGREEFHTSSYLVLHNLATLLKKNYNLYKNVMLSIDR